MNLAEKLLHNKTLTDEEFKILLETAEYDGALTAAADSVRREIYSDKVYIRGLIEFTNHCKNNCFYCGIRRGNVNIARYRLEKEDILDCCAEGYELGFRTFVLQGGEDAYFTDKILCDIVYSIRSKYEDCAITLSVGERSEQSYRNLYNAGANRFLLRHESADNALYEKLHPSNMSLDNRKKCLFTLREIGYQVGSGFMVGAPFQTTENLIADLRFLQELDPDMIGIGPYISHAQTPFCGFESGSFQLTLRLVSILRLMFPYALIPATTALGTIHPQGRELGLQAGANVVMPNLSPKKFRELYSLYDNKLSTGEESAQYVESLKARVREAGYTVVTDIGNVKKFLK